MVPDAHDRKVVSKIGCKNLKPFLLVDKENAESCSEKVHGDIQPICSFANGAQSLVSFVIKFGNFTGPKHNTDQSNNSLNKIHFLITLSIKSVR